MNWASNDATYRFPNNDLTEDELRSLIELARTGRLKMCVPEDHQRKLIQLRHAQRVGESLVATSRGRARLIDEPAY